MAVKRHRLCQRRKALGYSQERFAEILGVERSTVVRWENAETDPQPWHRTRIASALGVTLEQLDDMLVDVSVATHRGQAMGDETPNPASGAARLELLNGLRTYLTNYLTAPAGPAQSLLEVRRSVGRAHNLYQRASYTSASRLLPDVLSQATDLSSRSTGMHRSSSFRLLAAAYIAASKLATKVGDGETALLTADRASTAARLADDQPLAAVAAYQAACGLMRLPGRVTEAEQVVRTSIVRLTTTAPANDPDLLSAQGALLLLAAVMMAGQGNPKEAGQFLTQAEGLATTLGSDRNRLWTGFGPTNVVIHAVSAAVRAGNADRALEIGARLDTSRLPTGLVGRRAQVHVDLAAATMRSAGDRSVSVLHLLEAERIAAEMVHANVQARMLLLDLLSKERRAGTPGLRPLAERAGLLA
ncbi:DNA-binding transcriptional regulator, XRE-family HTH domain [Micromonospora coriariae]|uniref:DNA-binding transcriptional regulator, XRE-family HTH domain n=1 Tax=Micromonospora coriariae TaxID=285665 RepID=A0A1C4V2X2_9ACTN|nr:helix-turn-helix transcriptional regulator [Micromonospora coriariae]SCE78283.1 DNA-binding transcriptional regulator, XRE-family HTH domain [Micromonospora coriariae]